LLFVELQRATVRISRCAFTSNFLPLAIPISTENGAGCGANFTSYACDGKTIDIMTAISLSRRDAP